MPSFVHLCQICELKEKCTYVGFKSYQKHKRNDAFKHTSSDRNSIGDTSVYIYK